MFLRLRTAVEYALDEEGATFRLGDNYLPMRGTGLASWLPALVARLREPFELRTLLKDIHPAHQNTFQGVLTALQTAEMLLSGTQESDLRYAEGEARFAATISRIERTATDPVNRFRAMHLAPVLMIGRPELTFVVGNLASQSGLQHLMITPKQQSAMALAPMTSTTTIDESTVRLDHTDLISALDRAEYLIFAFTGSTDEESEIVALLKQAQERKLKRALVLMAYGDMAVFATVSRPDTPLCEACVFRHLSYLKRRSGSQTGSHRSDTFRLASALAVQRLWDGASQNCSSDEDFICFEIGDGVEAISTTVIQPTCPACLFAVNGPEDACTDSVANFEIEPFIKRATRLLVNSNTGVVRSVGEYDLLQYPCHRSAVELGTALVLQESRPQWIVETGGEVYEARTAALRSGVENWLRRECIVVDDKDEGGPNDALPLFGSQHHSESLLFSDVSSGLSYAAAVADGLGRTYATYAQQHSTWNSLDLTNVNDLMACHLRDTGVLHQIVVERSARKDAPLTVLRFSLRDRLICVAAGLNEQSLLDIGLSDVHTWICFQDSRLADAGSMDLPKYRADSALRSSSFAELRAMEERLEIQLTHRPIQGAVISFAAPFQFVHVVLRACSMRD